MMSDCRCEISATLAWKALAFRLYVNVETVHIQNSSECRLWDSEHCVMLYFAVEYQLFQYINFNSSQKPISGDQFKLQ